MGQNTRIKPECLETLVEHHIAGFRLHPTFPVFVRLRKVGLNSQGSRYQIELSPIGNFPPLSSTGGLPTAEGAIRWWDDENLATCLTQIIVKINPDQSVYQSLYVGANGRLLPKAA